MAPPIGTLWDAVGDTPLLRIRSLSKATGNTILGKAEFMNPGGSIGVRIGGSIQAGSPSAA